MSQDGERKYDVTWDAGNREWIVITPSNPADQVYTRDEAEAERDKLQRGYDARRAELRGARHGAK